MQNCECIYTVYAYERRPYSIYVPPTDIYLRAWVWLAIAWASFGCCYRYLEKDQELSRAV